MNRRQFIRIGSAAAASAIPLTTGVGGPIGDVAVVEAVTLPSSVHVLGETPTSPDQRLVKLLSDDVFDRLRGAFRRQWPTRAMRVVTVERVGQAVLEGAIQYQWNVSYKMHTSFTSDQPSYFPIDHFRWATNRWVRGLVICPDSPVYGDWTPPSAERVKDVPVVEMFGDCRVVGMPRLPDGLPWVAHYVDEDTGLVMRALYVVYIETDEYNLRWDVICG